MLRHLEELILFPGHLMGAPRSPAGDIEGLELLAIETPQGTVEAWFLPALRPASSAAHPVAIFAHGNGELIDDWPHVLEPYRRMGVSVCLPEYRGFGRSAGSPSERSIVGDFVEIYDRLRGRVDVDPSRIVFHGRSLGGGVVCALAEQRPAAGLVLESTFTSVADVAQRWFVPKGAITNRFDSERVVRSFPGPILLFHGLRDGVIPYAHALSLARAGRDCKLVTYDCGHNDLPRTAEGFWREIGEFLGTVGAKGERAGGGTRA